MLEASIIRQHRRYPNRMGGRRTGKTCTEKIIAPSTQQHQLQLEFIVALAAMQL